MKNEYFTDKFVLGAQVSLLTEQGQESPWKDAGEDSGSL